MASELGRLQCLEARLLDLMGKVEYLQAEVASMSQEAAARERRSSRRFTLLNLRVRVLEAKLPDVCKRFKERLLHVCLLMGISFKTIAGDAAGHTAQASPGS